jgi:hypothetical protein
MTDLWVRALNVTQAGAVNATLMMAACGVLIDCVETLHTRRWYLPDGVFSWTTRRASYSWRPSGVIGAALDRILAYPYFLALTILQLVCATLIVAGVTPLLPYAVGVIVAARFLTILRIGPYGGEGADQMLMIVLAAMGLYAISPESVAGRVVVWFLAAEVMLAYLTAGAIKLRTAAWRSGDAIQSVMGTTLFGTPVLAEAVAHTRWPSLVLCWMVMAFECLFPILVFCGPEVCAATLLAGVVMHASIAMLQGLNVFFWAFVSTYPAVWITARDVHAAVGDLLQRGTAG